MESNVRDDEHVLNTMRGFGEVSEQEGFYLAFRIKKDGSKKPLAFIESELEAAEVRASKNMEDIPEEEKEQTFLSWLFKG